MTIQCPIIVYKNEIFPSSQEIYFGVLKKMSGHPPDFCLSVDLSFHWFLKS